MLDPLVDSLCMGKIGVDVETDVHVSLTLSIWITMHVGCWSLIAARWVKYGCIICGMQFIGVDGLVIGTHCSNVGLSGLVSVVSFGIWGLGIWLGGVWWLVAVCLSVVLVYLDVCCCGVWLGVVAFVVLSFGSVVGICGTGDSKCGLEMGVSCIIGDGADVFSVHWYCLPWLSMMNLFGVDAGEMMASCIYDLVFLSDRNKTSWTG